jgi:ABC-type antimicrobial peptide transport system permease subunit
MTLGASRGSILRLVVTEALTTLATGVAIGIPLAWLAVSTAARVLFDARAPMLLPIASALALLTVVGAVAASLPALRAASINPLDAIRHD